MGIEIGARLLYGASYNELSGVERLDEMLDHGELDYASPYYDASREEWFVGVEIGAEFAGEAELLEAARTARRKFEGTTDGAQGRIAVGQHVT